MKRMMIVFLLLSTLVSAREIYDGYVLDGSNISIEDEHYTFGTDRKNSQLYVQLPTNSSMVIKNGSCEIRDFIEVCYIKKKYDAEIMDYMFRISISRLEPDFEVKRKVDNTASFINENINFFVEVENKGSQESYFNYSDFFHENVQVIACSGCEINDNGVFFGKFMTLNKRESFYYTIRPKESIRIISKPTINYTNILRIENIDIGTIEINVIKAPIEIDIQEPDDIKLYSIIDINFTLSKNIPSAAYVDGFEIILPKELILKEGRLNFSGEMPDMMKFPLKLKINSVNNLSVKYILSYKVKNVPQIIERKHIISVNKPKLNISVEMFDKYYEREVIDFRVRIEKDELVKNVWINLTSDGLDERFYMYNDSKKISGYKIPAVDETTNKSMVIKASYDAGTQSFTQEYSKIFEVINIGEGKKEIKEIYYYHYYLIPLVLFFAIAIFYFLKKFK